MTSRRTAIADFILLFLILAGCSRGSNDTTEAASHAAASDPDPSSVTLAGAGATFPYPLYSKWMSEYGKKTGVKINYQSIGSGGGIRQVIAGTVDFGASDAPMKPEEAAKAKGKLLHVPTTLGAVGVAANVTGVADGLALDAPTLAAIYLGEIKNWNDPRIAALNAEKALPDLAIAPVFRSDGSGTTSIFTDYLNKVDAGFKERVGQGKSVKWPSGIGAKGNEGVTGVVKTTPGAIGYLELAYAVQNKLALTRLKNRAGEFVAPSIEAVTKAAAGVELPAGDLFASITDSPSEGAYPIAAYTYLLVYEDMKDPVKGRALSEFLWWATHSGQSHCEALHYAPLPARVVNQVEARIRALRSGTTTLYQG